MRREIEAGLEEGVAILELAAPKRVLHENGRLAGVECLRMELGSTIQAAAAGPRRSPARSLPCRWTT